MSTDEQRADVIEALRNYQYYRDGFDDKSLAALDEPDVVRAIDYADDLVRVVCRSLGIASWELG